MLNAYRGPYSAKNTVKRSTKANPVWFEKTVWFFQIYRHKSMFLNNFKAHHILYSRSYSVDDSKVYQIANP